MGPAHPESSPGGREEPGWWSRVPGLSWTAWENLDLKPKAGATGCRWTCGWAHRKAQGAQDVSAHSLDSTRNKYQARHDRDLIPSGVYNFSAFDTFLPEPAEGSRVLWSAVPSSCLLLAGISVTHREHRATGPGDF